MLFKILLFGIVYSCNAMERIIESSEKQQPYFQILTQYFNCNNKKEEQNSFELKNERIVAVLKQEGIIGQDFTLGNSNGWLGTFKDSIRKEKVEAEKLRIWQVAMAALRSLPIFDKKKVYEFLVQYVQNEPNPSMTEFFNHIFSSKFFNRSSTRFYNYNNLFNMIWSCIQFIIAGIYVAYLFVPRSLALQQILYHVFGFSCTLFFISQVFLYEL